MIYSILLHVFFSFSRLVLHFYMYYFCSRVIAVFFHALTAQCAVSELNSRSVSKEIMLLRTVTAKQLVQVDVICC